MYVCTLDDASLNYEYRPLGGGGLSLGRERLGRDRRGRRPGGLNAVHVSG
jgi:hypothetical protein